MSILDEWVFILVNGDRSLHGAELSVYSVELSVYWRRYNIKMSITKTSSYQYRRLDNFR